MYVLKWKKTLAEHRRMLLFSQPVQDNWLVAAAGKEPLFTTMCAEVQVPEHQVKLLLLSIKKFCFQDVRVLSPHCTSLLLLEVVQPVFLKINKPSVAYAVSLSMIFGWQLMENKASVHHKVISLSMKQDFLPKQLFLKCLGNRHIAKLLLVVAYSS